MTQCSSTAPVQARPRRGNPRGSVLVVALVLILAMTGLGLVAFQTAVSATRTAGTFTMTRQANFLAELGVVTGVETLACSFSARDNSLGSGMLGGNSDFHSSDPLCGQSVSYFGAAPFGRRVGNAEFYVRYGPPVLAGQPTQSDSNVCLYRVRLDATGQMVAPGSASRIEVDQTVPTIVRRRAVGYVFVGPIFSEGCGGQNG